MTRRSGSAPHEMGGVTTEAVVTLDLETAGDTPILREYRAVKAEHPESIVLARLGDFYELFGRDAELAAPILGVTLTGRGFGSAGRLPMCGVPHHAMNGYVRRLLDAGHSVALWDQVGEVVSGKLVRREVTRVLTPGTRIDADYLDEATTVRCVAVSAHDHMVGLAAFDAAAGEMQLAELGGGLDSFALVDECARLDVGELLVGEERDIPDGVATGAARTELPAAYFDAGRARERLQALCGVSIASLDLSHDSPAWAAAGAVLAYCERLRVTLAPGCLRVRVRSRAGVMRLDAPTRRNLELVTPLNEDGTPLVRLLDRTRTPMGSRLLRARLQEPLTDAGAINERLDSITALTDRAFRNELREVLSGVRDLERLVGRCVQQLATPRDLAAVRDTLSLLGDVRAVLRGVPASELGDAAESCIAADALVVHLQTMLVDDPPPTAREGGVIRAGADAELDDLVAAGGDARSFIASLEARERERTGIRTLKVGYNRVFGYYLEVSNSQKDAVPDDYIRKQTLAGAERFITPDLKEQEIIVLSARDRAVARETDLIRDCMARIVAEAPQLLSAAAALATIDVSAGLATAAAERDWVRPDVDASEVLDIENGRHPLVEEGIGRGRFVPNDCSLDVADRIIVLTGPNMAGKSTYLRQVAIITLLAQVGSYVPAERARIGVCDRIFTRVGAHDDLVRGMSTFMVEMAETAAILRQATPKSLMILDEIGRGTSTYDGLSIARAILEHIHDAPQLNCRTLFATHYHELTALASDLGRIRNARVEVVEKGDEVTFLHRIVAGGADRSYGIHVGKLAGLPASVIQRARQLLAEMETARPLAVRSGDDDPDQLDLGFAGAERNPVVDELADLDIDLLTPIAALNKLAELHQRAR